MSQDNEIYEGDLTTLQVELTNKLLDPPNNQFDLTGQTSINIVLRRTDGFLIPKVAVVVGVPTAGLIQVIFVAVDTIGFVGQWWLQPDAVIPTWTGSFDSVPFQVLPVLPNVG